jgi:hypothetical protein
LIPVQITVVGDCKEGAKNTLCKAVTTEENAEKNIASTA